MQFPSNLNKTLLPCSFLFQIVSSHCVVGHPVVQHSNHYNIMMASICTDQCCIRPSAMLGLGHRVEQCILTMLGLHILSNRKIRLEYRKNKRIFFGQSSLISVDRSSKATQPLTIPRPIQAICKGSRPRNCQVGSHGQPDETFYTPQETRRVGAGNLPREAPEYPSG